MKVDWIKLGEERSSAFYKSIKQRWKRSAVVRLQNAAGDSIIGRHEIAAEILGFFSGLFGTYSPSVTPCFDGFNGTLIEYNLHTSLSQICTNEEVWTAITCIDKKKAPGPDGFESLFFTHCWKIIGTDVCNAVRDFFRRGRLLRQTNAAFINLIPKIDSPFLVKDFRPIACCNTVLKIISKILVRRIRPLLPDLVSYNQRAFVPGRRISDNIAVSQDLVKGYDCRTTSPRCLMQIDL